MRFKNLDLNLLVALDTLIRVRNVSRAAEEMFITQSAMSNALGRLRQYFDDPLLIQVGRTMELSPLAVALEPALRDIIVRIEVAVVSTPSFVPEESTRNFNLVVSDYTLHTIMPPFIAKLAERAPGITVNLQPQQAHPHVLLDRGEADLLIAPTIFCSSNHPSEVLLEDSICCVVDSSGKWARNGLTKESFETAGHIIMQPPNGGESFVQRIFDKAGIKTRIEITTYSFSSRPRLVIGSDRIALVQRKLAEKLQGVGGISIIDPPFAVPKLEQSIHWHSYRTRDTALLWIREQLREVAAVDVESCDMD